MVGGVCSDAWPIEEYTMAVVDAECESIRRVLLVSPSEACHRVARAIFQHSGYRLTAAASAHNAITHLRNEPADVVLSTSELHDCCWRDFVHVVHALPQHPSVVLFSPFADEALWVEVLEEGVWDLLSEPFDATEVRRVVMLACDARRLAGFTAAVTDRGIEPWPDFHSALLPAGVRQSLDASRYTRYVAGSSEGVILDCNLAFAAQLGRPLESVRGHHIREFLTDADAAGLEKRMQSGGSMLAPGFLLNFVNGNQSPFTLDCRMEASPRGFLLLGEVTSSGGDAALDEVLRINSELVVLAREMRREARLRQRKGAETLRETLDELMRAYGHLRAIQEMFCLCESCGAMTAQVGERHQVVRYLEEHDLLLSEGHCSRCEAQHQGEDGQG
jgi:CheY-like chemotaxis protein